MEKDAEKLLRIQFQMEMLVYTQDTTYSSSLDESKEEEQECKSQQKKGVNGYIVYTRSNQATMAELMLHIKSYYRVCVDHSIIQIIFLCFCGGRHQNFVSYALDCKSTPGWPDPSSDPLSHAARICHSAAERAASAAAGQREYWILADGGLSCWDQAAGFAGPPQTTHTGPRIPGEVLGVKDWFFFSTVVFKKCYFIFLLETEGDHYHNLLQMLSINSRNIFSVYNSSNICRRHMAKWCSSFQLSYQKIQNIFFWW